MPINQDNPYYHQVALLPLVEEDCFALKGGTAIEVLEDTRLRLVKEINNKLMANFYLLLNHYGRIGAC